MIKMVCDLGLAEELNLRTFFTPPKYMELSMCMMHCAEEEKICCP